MRITGWSMCCNDNPGPPYNVSAQQMANAVFKIKADTMKKFSIYLRLVLFFGAIGGFNESLIAQNQVVRYIQVLNGALGQLAVDSNRIVMDSAFFDPIVKPSIVRTNKVTNIIKDRTRDV